MTPKAGYRGQPLFMLVMLLGGWVGVRTALWEPAFPPRYTPRSLASAARTARDTASAPKNDPEQQLAEPGESGAAPTSESPQVRDAWLQLTAAPRASRTNSLIGDIPSPARLPGRGLFPVRVHRPDSLARAASSAAPRTEAPPPAAAPFGPLPSNPGASRWSGDVWLLLREDTTTAITSGRGSYGQSQAGAVLRYLMAPSSAHRPAVFTRASRALAGAEETEVAAGLSARPIPSVPVVAAAELRATRVGGEVRWRPAAYAYTQLPEFRLPLGWSAEAYAQAGYVGGDFATAFVDGQVRAERELARLEKMRLSAGGGAWGGAQKGAERLDIGPGATARITIGSVPARVSLDWRFRVAGDAEPSSGPTLTIATGF